MDKKLQYKKLTKQLQKLIEKSRSNLISPEAEQSHQLKVRDVCEELRQIGVTTLYLKMNAFGYLGLFNTETLSFE